MRNRPQYTIRSRCAGFLTMLLLAGCSDAPTSPPPVPVPIQPPPADPALAIHPDIARTWAELWAQTWPLDQRPPSQWPTVLAALADQPLTAQLTHRKTEALAHGVRLYGHIQPHVTAIQNHGDQATVTDCQDTSRAGQADLNGQPKTVGTTGNRVLGTLLRTPTGWHVSHVDYIEGGC